MSEQLSLPAVHGPAIPGIIFITPEGEREGGREGGMSNPTFVKYDQI